MYILVPGAERIEEEGFFHIVHLLCRLSWRNFEVNLFGCNFVSYFCNFYFLVVVVVVVVVYIFTVYKLFFAKKKEKGWGISRSGSSWMSFDLFIFYFLFSQESCYPNDNVTYFEKFSKEFSSKWDM